MIQVLLIYTPCKQKYDMSDVNKLFQYEACISLNNRQPIFRFQLRNRNTSKNIVNRKEK